MKLENREEEIISRLTQLYKRRGYKLYKPSCFEEYALYQENKDFLIGKNVITFSDLDGKLMAMRPDVTLSLIRHIDVDKGGADKFFYNEKVYRQTVGSCGFKEISQTGVEVVGAIDQTVVAEIAILICQSLAVLSENYVLDISHIGFISGLIKEFGNNEDKIVTYLKKKNLHDFYKLAKVEKYGDKLIKAFEVAATYDGNIENVLSLAKGVALNEEMLCAVEELERVTKTLQKFGFGERVNVNFSASANADYYNGVIFNGYLQGIPHCVLTGGRYDKLLAKFGKQSGAIGFAIYLGEIEKYLPKDDGGVDYLIIYDNSTQETALEFAQSKLNEGSSVRLSCNVPSGIIFKNKVDFTAEAGK